MAVGPQPASGDRPTQPAAARRLLRGLGRLLRALITLALMAAVSVGAAYVAITVELDRRGLTGGTATPEALAGRLASVEDKANRLAGDLEMVRTTLSGRVSTLEAALEALRAPRGATEPPGAESALASEIARLERLLDGARWLLKAQGELMSARLELARLNAGRAAEEAELAAESLRRAAAALAPPGPADGTSRPAEGESAAGPAPEPPLPERGAGALPASLRRLADQLREAAVDLRAGRPTGADRLSFAWHGLGLALDALLGPLEPR